MLGIIKTVNGQKKVIPLTADAGAGNPVGTIIVVCSNQIPSNYLPLGTQYDTSLYPVLYALLGTDTTPTASALGLPTLTSGQYAIKATSGLSENAQDNVVAQLQNITISKPKLESYTPITLPTSGNAIILTEGWYSLRAGSTASSWIDITIIINAHTIPVCSARNSTSGSTIAGTMVYIMAGTYDVKYSGSVELNKLS